jgi:hypothetical protein
VEFGTNDEMARAMKYLILLLVVGCTGVDYKCGKTTILVDVNQPAESDEFLCPLDSHLTVEKVSENVFKTGVEYKVHCECDK